MSEKQKQGHQFPIVGIGASAGGLKALEEFFKAMPQNCNTAFIIVQHLSPDYESQLPQILANYTTMPVHQIINQMEIEINAVYVIPPKNNVEIHDRKLFLKAMTDPPALPVSIDLFFQSLAEALWDLSIAIILSGTGTDGIVGVRAIKEHSGMTMAQSPDTAKYGGMPQSAIDSGNIDIVASTVALPALLLAYIQKQQDLEKQGDELQITTNNLRHIFHIMQEYEGKDFSLYKHNTMIRRIARRMVINKIDLLGHYTQELRRNKVERELLIQDLLIGVTRFFRDPFIFDVLREKVLHRFLDLVQENQAIRVWVSGCSTGEEAYSIAIAIYDFLGANVASDTLQIFATDINAKSIQFARQGLYRLNVANDIPPDYLDKYFIKQAKGYQIHSNIRQLIIFAVHNVLTDPPFSNLDMISFRNVLIYFQVPAQEKVFDIFRYALKSDSVLLLGTSEALGTSRHSFEVIDGKAKLFRLRKSLIKTGVTFDLSTMPVSTSKNEKTTIMLPQKSDLQPFVEKLLLSDFVSSCVITNSDGDILYFHNRTGKYLEPATGKANLNVLQMARKGLEIPLANAFHKAINEERDIRHEQIEVATNGYKQMINLIIHPIQTPKELQGLILIIFEDIQGVATSELELQKLDTDDDRSQYVAKIKRDLETTQAFLQTTREELEASNEELKSTNEELQSANEELQSANEELETSKEEVNSVNEELMSTNAELQTKIEGSSRANNDLQNILNSIEVGIIFLDNDLNIKRFNPAVMRLFNVIDSDLGRSITHITSTFKQDNLINDIQAVLDRLIERSIEISTNIDEWFIMTIRPYRTIDNIIDGVILMFKDISAHKQSQLLLKQQQNYAETIIQTIRHPFLILNEEFHVISTNEAFFKLFSVFQGDTIEKSIFELGNGQWNIPELRQLLEELINNKTVVEGFVVQHNFPHIGMKTVIIDAHTIDYEPSGKSLILLAMDEVTVQDKL